LATIKDVAQAADVSITTVSHVINGTRHVSDELRLRVLKAMTELDYRPNVLARSLRLGQTKTVGLIVPDNSNPFFAEMARTIEDVGYNNGYSVILCNTDGNPEKQESYVRMLATKRVDGVIFVSAGGSEMDPQYLVDEGIHVVIVDRDVPNVPADIVLVDNEQGGYQATRYLIDLGHRRIACVTGPFELTPSAQRTDGYRRALREAAIDLNQAYVVGGDFQSQSGEAALARLLALDQRPTALFACNDMMAIGVVRAARQFGLTVPDDLSVVGFDDIPLAEVISPALTTVAQPLADMSRIASDLLIQRMQGRAVSPEWQRIVLTTKLIVRDSCRSC
jgi:LacI family transcriptional regulator